MYHGLFLDDRKEEAQYASFLSVEGELGLTTVFQLVDQPLEEMGGLVLERHPDLLALDYRLDDAQTPGNVGVRYKAGPLAQQLRDRTLDSAGDNFPIVLVSHEKIIQNYYRPDLTTHNLFDRIYPKETLVTDRERIKQELLALVEGYKTIINLWEDKARLLNLLGLTSEEEDTSMVGNQELRRWKDLKSPHQLAREILRSIIDRNGLLRDRPSLLARLGIAQNSPDIDAFISKLKTRGIIYHGVFHRGWERWWDYQIEVFGAKNCEKELGNLSARERVKCWNGLFSLELVAATSRWTGSDEMFPSFACSSCRNPTEKMHSVVAFDPALPSFVERKRICWDCVARGKYEDEKLTIDDSESYIVNKIKNGEIAQENKGA